MLFPEHQAEGMELRWSGQTILLLTDPRMPFFSPQKSEYTSVAQEEAALLPGML